jgi:hypothetical protein
MSNSTEDETITAQKLTLQQKAFFSSEAGKNLALQLRLMVSDPKYNTRESFTPTNKSVLSFVEKHMLYMSNKPKLSPQHYLANLRLMTRIRH